MYDASVSSSVYFELDITGNVRRLRGGKALSTAAPLASDLGGYRFTAFGHLNTTDTATAYPSVAGQRYDQPLRWQSRWFIDSGSGLYDFRARVWSPELGAFLQPDEYGFLTRSGTLWSWPGQNPFRWRDPSGRDGVVFGFTADFGAISQFNYTTGVVDAGSSSGGVGFTQTSFNVGPGGSTGLGGQFGYFAGTPADFANSTTLHVGALQLGSLNFYTKKGESFPSGITYGNGFGFDLGILRSTTSKTTFEPQPCTDNAASAPSAPTASAPPSAGGGGAPNEPELGGPDEGAR